MRGLHGGRVQTGKKYCEWEGKRSPVSLLVVFFFQFQKNEDKSKREDLKSLTPKLLLGKACPGLHTNSSTFHHPVCKGKFPQDTNYLTVGWHGLTILPLVCTTMGNNPQGRDYTCWPPATSALYQKTKKTFFSGCRIY